MAFPRGTHHSLPPLWVLLVHCGVQITQVVLNSIRISLLVQKYMHVWQDQLELLN